MTKTYSNYILMSFTLAVLTLIWATQLHAQEKQALQDHVVKEFGEPPTVPDGPLSEALQKAVKTAFIDSMTQKSWGNDQNLALVQIVEAKDPRLVWIIADLMRFATSPNLSTVLAQAAYTLLEAKPKSDNHWGSITNYLMAWDIPAPPDYLTAKRAIFTSIVPGWDKFFVEGDIDWRHVSWGGVLIDNRAHDETDRMVRVYLARVGMKKGDLSALVEDAVQGEILRREADALREKDPKLTADEAAELARNLAAIERGMDEVRAGNGHPMKDALREIADELGLKLER